MITCRLQWLPKALWFILAHFTLKLLSLHILSWKLLSSIHFILEVFHLETFYFQIILSWHQDSKIKCYKIKVVQIKVFKIKVSKIKHHFHVCESDVLSSKIYKKYKKWTLSWVIHLDDVCGIVLSNNGAIVGAIKRMVIKMVQVKWVCSPVICIIPCKNNLFRKSNACANGLHHKNGCIKSSSQLTLGRFTPYWTITDFFTFKWLKNWWEIGWKM